MFSPQTITTDQGSMFISEEFGEFAASMGIGRRKDSAPYDWWIWKGDHAPRSKILLTEGEEVDQIFWLRFSKSYLIFRSRFYSLE